ncbi:hypothetical protein F5J12DRAFT_700751, partial [Pisolithus orientalis]|uniref:uncharacterized protein n=1 Tax=Pisolithus orientalis TaxID=936130 RepID=UPI00222480E1
PILLGELIPLPHKVDWCMEEFCWAMLLLFCAWQRPSDLLCGYLCWTEAFDTYQLGASASSIISNFFIELECRDARDAMQD